jgi:hypothetical protein
MDDPFLLISRRHPSDVRLTVNSFDVSSDINDPPYCQPDTSPISSVFTDSEEESNNEGLEFALPSPLLFRKSAWILNSIFFRMPMAIVESYALLAESTPISTSESTKPTPIKRTRPAVHRRNHSWIWSHVTEGTDEAGLSRMKCDQCDYHFSPKTSNSSIARHLLAQHQLCKGSGQERTELTNGQAFNDDDFHQHIITLICKANLPLAIVDQPDFLAYSRFLNSRAIVPSSRTIRQKILDCASTLRTQLQQLMQEAPVAITTDLWTQHSFSFIGITAHFFSHDCTLVHCTLGLLRFSGKHVVDKVYEKLIESIAQFTSLSQVCSITTDSASNMLALRNLTTIPHYSCFAHALQLIIKAGLREPSVAAVLKACRKIAEFFHRSSVAQDTLSKHFTKDCRIALPSATRWSGDFLMLESMLKLKASICASLLTLNALSVDVPEEIADCNEESSADESYIDFSAQQSHPPMQAMSGGSLILSQEQWVLVENLVAILRDYALRTTLLNGSNCFLSDVAVMAENLEHEWNSATGIHEAMVNLMRLKSQRLKVSPFISITDPVGVHVKCMALDPRYKSREMVKDVTWRALLEEASHLVAVPPLENSVAQQSVASRLLSGAVRSQTCLNEIEFERLAYLQLPCLAVDCSMSQMASWFGVARLQCPNITRLALRYLTIQPTEVPSERLFSQAGRVFTDERSKLSHDLLEAIVFIHDNSDICSKSYS